MNRLSRQYFISLIALTIGTAVIGVVVLARTAPDWMNANKSLVTAAALTIAMIPWVIAVWRLRNS